MYFDVSQKVTMIYSILWMTSTISVTRNTPTHLCPAAEDRTVEPNSAMSHPGKCTRSYPGCCGT